MTTQITRTCRDCEGSGRAAKGHRIGPNEWQWDVPCETCRGSGQEPADCDVCGEPAATCDASERLYLCDFHAEEG